MRALRFLGDIFNELAMPLIIFIVVLFIFIGVPVSYYTAWTCNNFEEATGRETKYIHFDACYVKNADGNFIRYDSNYKN